MRHFGLFSNTVLYISRNWLSQLTFGTTNNPGQLLTLSLHKLVEKRCHLSIVLSPKSFWCWCRSNIKPRSTMLPNFARGQLLLCWRNCWHIQQKKVRKRVDFHLREEAGQGLFRPWHCSVSRRVLQWPIFNKSQCLKIIEKVAFNIASEASYVYTLLKMPKMVHFVEFMKTWSLRSNSVTRQVTFDMTKNWWKMPKLKNYHATFWVIFKHCAIWAGRQLQEERKGEKKRKIGM